MADTVENPISLQSSFRIEINGWHDDDDAGAKQFGERLMALTQTYSRFLDLSLLERVIVALDYPKALAECRPNADLPEAMPTSNEFGQGAAMAVPIFLGGDSFSSVVVVQTELIRRMFDEGDDLRDASHQSYAHELVHVDDQAHFHKTFPGGTAAGIIPNEREGELVRICDAALSEYSATRRSAAIEPLTGLQFLDMLENVLKDFPTEMEQRRRAYQSRNEELHDYWLWVRERASFVFQSLGYALGHYDAIIDDEAISAETREEHRSKLAEIEAGALGWLVSDTREAVLPIYGQEAWTGLDVYDPLKAVAEKLLNQFGLHTSNRNAGLYIDVPFRGFRDL